MGLERQAPRARFGLSGAVTGCSFSQKPRQARFLTKTAAEHPAFPALGWPAGSGRSATKRCDKRWVRFGLSEQTFLTHLSYTPWEFGRKTRHIRPELPVEAISRQPADRAELRTGLTGFCPTSAPAPQPCLARRPVDVPLTGHLVAPVPTDTTVSSTLTFGVAYRCQLGVVLRLGSRRAEQAS